MAGSRKDDRIEVENVNHPGKTHRLARAPYEHVRDVLLGLLPATPPGLTFDEMAEGVRARASPEMFPGGERVGWWLKSVQLDLEAKGVLQRSKDRGPTRWSRKT